MAIAFVRATYVEQYALERFFTGIFGVGTCMVIWKRGRFQCTIPRPLEPAEITNLQEVEENVPGPASGFVVTSWGKKVTLSDVAGKDGNSTHLRAGSIEGTTDTGPCTVYDGGDKAQLKTTGRHVKEQPRQRQRPSDTTQTHLLSHTGDHFQERTGLLDRSSTLDIGPHAEFDVVEFDTLVFTSCSNHNGKDNRFLPFDKLDQIVTKERIYMELQSYFREWSVSQLEGYTSQIWGTSSVPVTRRNSVDERSRTHTDQTTRRKLFTILAYMKKLDLIPRFIKSEIYDRHLPFTFRYDKEGAASVRFTLESTKSSTEVFRGWGYSCLEQFDTFQWRLLSPFFSLGSTPPLHYVLPDPTILPFNKKSCRVSVGGFGEVEKITIHRAHYQDSTSETRSSQATDTESPPLARKKLLSSKEADFRRELDNHRRMPPHPSLIRLLASYERKGYYYLIFPWADGNLLDFWKENSQPAQPNQHPEVILWFSKQCLTLMEGLNAIHNAGSFFADSPPPQGIKAHGRHGDLKPHNILWFKEDVEGETSLGNFKYCDFGVTAFHSTESMQESHDKYARTLTYMAPESKMKYKIEPSYDIFSLGCILLEFVTWYLGGWEVVENFTNCRLHNDEDNYYESVRIDSFYNFFPSNTHTNSKASLKPDVKKQFDDLRSHPLCVDYLVDLLNLIQDRMIRMTPGNRAGVQDLVSQLQELDRLCQEGTSYTTKNTKDCPRRADTDLSSLAGCPTMRTTDTSLLARECRTDSVRQSHATRSTFRKNSIGHEQERQKKPNSKPPVLHEGSTLVQTEGLGTDAFDGGHPKERQVLPGSLEPTAANSETAVLHKDPTLVQTEGLDTDAVDRAQPKKSQDPPGPCEGPAATSQGEDCRSGDVRVEGRLSAAVVAQQPYSEREPLLKRPSQEFESPGAPGDVSSPSALWDMWSSFCRLLC
ncbi:uncharacterized protein DNG_08122 [Cephalotrichum gorgonifer]|uniref:Protein kinase domain-containing protein n=1 Tax=Cephalotrichum gorgonifer TaxID=2041049 RepID=A0AAE8N360_9PEZI|nr:uncharacterized protein DNG_08122 [Cephalotrichum gorgonifer]